MSIEAIPFDSHGQWLEIRGRYIGGSDAGAVMGLDEYKSPFSLWAEKTGKVPPFEGNIATETGTYLEDFVARLWCRETGKKVRRRNRVLVNSDYPWACANVDRLVCGESALLECKTTTSLPVMRKVRGGEFPDRWYCQVMHYLAVTGLQKAYLAALVSNRELHCFELERDEDEIRALMAAESGFWEHVVSNTAPPTDGSEATSEALEAMYSASGDEDETVDLMGEEDLLARYVAVKDEIKALGEQADAIANRIKARLGEAARGEAGPYTVSWREQIRNTFDVRAYARDNPTTELGPYYKVSKSRPFKVTRREA